MNITIDSINETRKAITVTVPIELIKEEEKKVLKAAMEKVAIPGFRRGKVPMQILKTRYAKELDAEMHQKVIDAAYRHLIDNEGVKPYAIVKIDIQGDKITDDQEAVLTFLVDLKPSFELPEYKGIQVTGPAVEVTESEIQAGIEAILKQDVEYIVTDEAAQKGDYVRLSYEGKIGDQTIADLLPRKTIYGTQKSTWEQAGAENVPGVSAVIEGIVGMKAGDFKNVTMHFAEDFQIKELAGQVATYEIFVEEVRKMVCAELNEALLEKLHFASVQELQDSVKDDITKHKTNAAQSYVKNKIMEHLLNSISFPISESAIKDEEEALLRLYMTRMMRHGLSEEEIEAKRDEMINVAEKEAIPHAKGNVILNAIATQENIELTNQDLNACVMHEAYRAGIKPQQFIKQLEKDRQLVQDVRKNALFHKVLDFLYKQSRVTYEGNVDERF